MSDVFKRSLRKVSRAGKKAVRKATSESSLRKVRKGVSAGRERAEDTSRAVAQSPVAQKAASAARTAAASGPVKQVAYMCGRAGVAGAIVDGSLGGFQSLKAMQEGRIDGKQAVIHTGAEAGCGFVTSSSGTAGTVVAFMLTGKMGPVALAAGMGASLGSRYIYRKVVGETLPDDEEQSDVDVDADANTDDSPMEDIGPDDE